MGRKYNPHYDPKSVCTHLAWLLALIVAMMATEGMASLLLLALLLFYLAMRRPDKLLFVILLGSSLMMMCGTLAPKTVVSAAALKIQMLIAAVALFTQIFGHKQTRLLTPLWSLIPYLLFMIVSSSKGWSPVISYLKLFLFTMIFLAYYGCAVQTIGARNVDSRGLRSMFLAVIVFFVIGSVLVYPFPAISTMGSEEAIRSGASSFYRGVTNHSQTLGVLMAVFGSLTFADLVFNIQRADRLYILILICAAILIYMSASRTAMASFIAGIAISAYLAMHARDVGHTWRGKVVSFMTSLIVVGTLVVAVVPTFRNKVLTFAIKYDSFGTTVLTQEELFKTRQGKWDEAKENWRRSPYIGNGFQVSEDMKYRKIEGVKDMLSAPVEKSTWTWAVLEEGGIFGMCLFCFFLLSVVLSWIRRRAYVALSVFLAFLLTNLGEFSFFSMSSDGGLFWFLVFLGVILDHKRLSKETQPYAMPLGRIW